MAAKKRTTKKKTGPSRATKKKRSGSTRSTTASGTRRRRLPYTTHRATTWTEYLRIAKSDLYGQWAFRGHADARWELVSTLPRFFKDHKVHPDHWQHLERRSVDKFQSKAHHFLAHIPDRDDTLQWLALMQHHGAPTRLLDFTWSPYVAAFFALENATGDAAVWAINGARITWDEGPRDERGNLVYDARRPSILRRHYMEEESNRVFVGEPDRLNERLIAQSGTFAVPGTVRQPLNKILAKHAFPRDILTKIVLPQRIRREAIEDLHHMNIMNATLFPGIDGLAKSIAYELEFHWAFDTTLKGYRRR
jgi:hypothetical protein